MEPKFKVGDIIKNFTDEHMLVVSCNKMLSVYDLYYMQNKFNTRDVFIEVVDEECVLVQRVNR